MRTLLLLPVVALLGVLLMTLASVSWLLGTTSDLLDQLANRLVELGDWLTDY